MKSPFLGATVGFREGNRSIYQFPILLSRPLQGLLAAFLSGKTAPSVHPGMGPPGKTIKGGQSSREDVFFNRLLFLGLFFVTTYGETIFNFYIMSN